LLGRRNSHRATDIPPCILVFCVIGVCSTVTITLVLLMILHDRDLLPGEADRVENVSPLTRLLSNIWTRSHLYLWTWEAENNPRYYASITFPSPPLGATTVQRPPEMGLLELNVPDYAGLKMGSLQSRHGKAWQRRLIPWEHDLALLHLKFQARMKEEEHSEEYSQDYYFPEDLTFPQQCRRNKISWQHYPVCNTIHELPSIRPREAGAEELPLRLESRTEKAVWPAAPGAESTVKYLGHGYYRDSWLITSCGEPTRENGTTVACTGDESVMKTLKGLDIGDHEGHDFDYYQMRKVAQEAIAMEELTASPRIVDIHGHCATTILAEYLTGEITTRIVPDRKTGSKDGKNRGRISQEDLDELQQDDVYPLNNLTALEKVTMALFMAKSVADLHGLKSGVFVHGDVHPDQWLTDKNGALKLNDFNNGRFLDYNPSNLEYCKFFSIFGGTYKSAEEFRGDYVDESVDTFAIGHGIYGLLTGLYPFYDITSHNQIRRLVKQGAKPFVDDRYRARSFIEGELVNLMEECWRFEPKDRPTIFEIVKYLRGIIQQSKHYNHHATSSADDGTTGEAANHEQ
jgi:Protein kinase domain